MPETSSSMLDRLKKPQGRVDVVFDTDTFNEVDDQYALAYLLRSNDKLNLKAIYAAPFFNAHAESAADGMEKSYQEILKVLSLAGCGHLSDIVHRGAQTYLPDEATPAQSPAAGHLARLAMDYTPEMPLYVIGVAAITNIASAILLNPEIINRIVVVWLGGNAHDWHDTMEFNMYQDIAAARVVFGCGAALVQLPCAGVVSAFATTGPELEHWLSGKNELCDYLVEKTRDEAVFSDGGDFWSRTIWDVTAVAWLLDGEFMLERLEHSPIPQYDYHYSFDHTRHLIKYVYHVQRDLLFGDLFTKLAQ